MKKGIYLFFAIILILSISVSVLCLQHKAGTGFNANIEALTLPEIAELPCTPSYGDICFTVITDAVGNTYSAKIENMKNYFPGI